MTEYQYGIYHDLYEEFYGYDTKEEAVRVRDKYHGKGYENNVFLVRRPVGKWELEQDWGK